MSNAHGKRSPMRTPGALEQVWQTRTATGEAADGFRKQGQRRQDRAPEGAAAGQRTEEDAQAQKDAPAPKPAVKRSRKAAIS
jgi:hypothetical protein